MVFECSKDALKVKTAFYPLSLVELLLKLGSTLHTAALSQVLQRQQCTHTAAHQLAK